MKDLLSLLETNDSLDPVNWEEMKGLAHEMVEDMFAYLKPCVEQSVWKAIPEEIKTTFEQPLPSLPESPLSVYQKFKDTILPYSKGNIHPRFWGWAIGTGSPFGMMAEMLAGGLNPDICMGAHAPMYVEEQVINWLKVFMGFPSDAGGTLVSGTSMANLTGLLAARNNCHEQRIREEGLCGLTQKGLVMYASSEVHSCIKKAAEVMGIGRSALRLIKVDQRYRMISEELTKRIEQDRADGYEPFCVVATVGSVNTGAIDPLDEIREVCNRFKLWMHIDGAFGALARNVPEYKEELKTMQLANSLAFDLHKWFSVPMGCGCVIVKDKTAFRNSFSLQSNYLVQFKEGVAAGPDPTFNYGIEMTKPFRALKVWMTVREHGIEHHTAIIRRNIAQAFYLQQLVQQEATLEMVTPVILNIVCFRYIYGEFELERLNQINQDILLKIQNSGIAVLSHTMLNEQFVLRAAMLNHRTQKADLHFLIKLVIEFGQQAINGT